MARAYPQCLPPGRCRQLMKAGLGPRLGLGRPDLQVSSLAPPPVDPLPPPQVHSPLPRHFLPLVHPLFVVPPRSTLLPHRLWSRQMRRSATLSGAAATRPDGEDWLPMLGLPAIYHHPTAPSRTSG